MKPGTGKKVAYSLAVVIALVFIVQVVVLRDPGPRPVTDVQEVEDVTQGPLPLALHDDYSDVTFSDPPLVEPEPVATKTSWTQFNSSRKCFAHGGRHVLTLMGSTKTVSTSGISLDDGSNGGDGSFVQGLVRIDQESPVFVRSLPFDLVANECYLIYADHGQMKVWRVVQ